MDVSPMFLHNGDYLDPLTDRSLDRLYNSYKGFELEDVAKKINLFYSREVEDRSYFNKMNELDSLKEGHDNEKGKLLIRKMEAFRKSNS